MAIHLIKLRRNTHIKHQGMPFTIIIYLQLNLHMPHCILLNVYAGPKIRVKRVCLLLDQRASKGDTTERLQANDRFASCPSASVFLTLAYSTFLNS